MRVRVFLGLVAMVVAVSLATLSLGLAGGIAIGYAIAIVAYAVSLHSKRRHNTPVPQAGPAANDVLEPANDTVQAPMPTVEDNPSIANETIPAGEGMPEAQDAQAEDAEAQDIAHGAPAHATAEQPQASTDAPIACDEGPQPDEPSKKPSEFDLTALMQSILTSAHPLSTLRQIADDIQGKRDRGEDVLPIEDFLQRELQEAGLYEKDTEAERRLRLVLPHHSRLFYLRIPRHGVTYGFWLRMIHIESVLNSLLFAFENFDDLSKVQIEDLYKLRQRVLASICAQAPNVDTADWSYLAMPWQVPYGPAEQGEWAVRQAVSEAIESVRLPYRLEVRFRCNVAEGDVALEFGATPSRVFPKAAYTQGLGIVPTTRQMRSREATNYAARVGLLLAGFAFHASNRIRRVWISAIEETPKTHVCLYSLCTDRRSFSHIRLDRVKDPVGSLQQLGASMRLAEFELLPVEPRFYLEDDRFCPAYRHDLWELSERSLPPATTRPLGCSRVSGLLIHEQLPRDVVADKILRSLPTGEDAQSTQKSVRTVLETAHDTSDLTVWSAADRVATKLVEGTLDLSNPEELRTEFVEGDALSKAVREAQEHLSNQHPHDALDILSTTLGKLDAEGRYHDSSAIVYRCFDSFVERVLYNRLHKDDTRSVELAPDAYPLAHLMLSAIYSSLPSDDGGSEQKALAHARRALEVTPFGASSHLCVSACLEAMGDSQAAAQQLCTFLESAFYNQSIGMAYFRLASLQWELGHKDACRACYFQATKAMPALLPFAFAEYESLSSQDEDSKTYEINEEEVTRVLNRANIPLAPTNATAFLLYDGAVASVDAEVFPVAHDLLLALESLTGDDVLHGIRMSLEHEPDA